MLSLPSTGRDESGDGVGLACLVIPYIRDLLPPPLHLSLISRSPFVFPSSLFRSLPSAAGTLAWYSSRDTREHRISIRSSQHIRRNSRTGLIWARRETVPLRAAYMRLTSGTGRSSRRAARSKGLEVEALTVIVERFDDPPYTCPVHGDKYLTGVNGNTREHRR